MPPWWLVPLNLLRFYGERWFGQQAPASPLPLPQWHENTLLDQHLLPLPQRQERQSVLQERYGDLAALPLVASSSPLTSQQWVYWESLQHLHWLDATLAAWLTGLQARGKQQGVASESCALPCLDVGSKQWAYALGQWAFTQTAFPASNWEGVELDAHRRYSLWHRRLDYAKGVEALAPQALQYRVGDVRDLLPPPPSPLFPSGGYGLVVQSLPFVVPDPHLHWGLPWHHYQPAALLEHLLVQLLAKGGCLLILNLTPYEAVAQKRLLEALQQKVADHSPFRIHEYGHLEAPFLHSPHGRWGFVCEKLANE